MLQALCYNGIIPTLVHHKDGLKWETCGSKIAAVEYYVAAFTYKHHNGQSKFVLCIKISEFHCCISTLLLITSKLPIYLCVCFINLLQCQSWLPWTWTELKLNLNGAESWYHRLLISFYACWFIKMTKWICQNNISISNPLML